MVVAVLLVILYIDQILHPLLTETTTVQVNLTQPSLVATELVLIVLALVWLSVAIGDYAFTQRVSKQIEEIRKLEREVMQKYGLSEEPVQDDV